MASAIRMSRFRRLTITHAAMMGGDAAMLVALADSLFLSIDPSAARSRVLLFLVISFAPFLLVAPLIGPAIDRAAGGRRTVIQLIAGTRVVLALGIAASLHSLRLFPLVFIALVLQKAYIVSKQALVPSVVRSDSELVEANSKLGVISGLTGFVAVIPAALLQLTPARGWGTLIYSGALFAYALASATRLPADVVAGEPGAAGGEGPAALGRAAAGRLRDDDPAGRRRLRVLPAGVLAARPDGRHGLVRPRHRALGRRHDRRQRGVAAHPRPDPRGADAGRRPRSVGGGRHRRRGDERRGGRRAARRGGQLQRRRRAAGVREHRPARRPAGQPRPGLRQVRDPLPAGVGDGRLDPRDHRDPRLGRLPRRRAGVRGGDAQLHRRHAVVEPRLRRRRLPRPQIPWRRRPVHGRPLPPPRPEGRRNAP